MASNAIFFGWNRGVPGREHVSAEHFQQYVGWLNDLKSKGTITDFQITFLRPHAGQRRVSARRFIAALVPARMRRI